MTPSGIFTIARRLAATFDTGGISRNPFLSLSREHRALKKMRSFGAGDDLVTGCIVPVLARTRISPAWRSTGYNRYFESRARQLGSFGPDQELGMPILTLYRRLVLSVVGTVAVGCGGGDSTGPGLPPLPNEVRLESDPGDYIGGGGSYVYTLANADIQVWTDRGYFNIAIAGDERWSGDFQLPNRLGRIEPGTYDGVARYPFHDPSVGGMSWRGEGRGCNSLSARIAIDSVRYAGEELASVALRFEQRCEGASSALRGTIRWRSDDETRPAGPLHPVPGTLWKPAVVVPSGTFVHLSSQAGDYIGAGTMYTYTPADAEIIATEDQGLLRVTVDAEEWWAGEFQAMHSLDRIEPGYYGDLRRYPFNNPTKGGLSWTGNGRGCNELVGWFAVDDVTYGDGALANISIRFEQICDGGPGALRGAVRWQRPEQTTAP